MAIRLRYLGHNLVVPEGQFVIGRSSQCQLSIDDPLISRKHAILQVQGDSATLLDLGSRNGVQVNGTQVRGQQALTDGDTITVGGQSLTVFGIGTSERPQPRRSDLETQTISGFENSEDTGEATVIHGMPHASTVPDKRVHELSLIGAVADKALAMGRAEDAHRLLERPLREILARAQGKSEHSGRFDPSSDRAAAERGTLLALRIASLLGKGDWIDFCFDLYLARRELMPQPAIDELYAIVRRVRFDTNRLRNYLELLHDLEADLGPSQRFLVSRLEGLEPLLGLK